MKPGVTISPFDVHDHGGVEARLGRVADEADALSPSPPTSWRSGGCPEPSWTRPPTSRRSTVGWARKSSIPAVHNTATATADKSARYRRRR